MTDNTPTNTLTKSVNTPTNTLTQQQIEERVDLEDVLDYAGRDWDNYLDECYEEGVSPQDSYYDFLADAVLSAGYRKQSVGEWVVVADYGESKVVKCTNCDHEFYFKKKGQLNIDKMPHCPKCGAKMKGGEG